jgi:UDP-N-acetylmuramate dehydrogenase
MAAFEIEENISLAPFTTLGVGGAARMFARPNNEAELLRALQFAKANELEIFILGGGSNIVVSDAGFDGIVIYLGGLQGLEFLVEGNVRASAGEDWDYFVGLTVAIDLAGIECLSGIPGFVGGTPVQNVGAYGQDVSETIVSVRCYDREAEEFVELSNADCGFTYRKSIFNSTDRERYIVTAVSFKLIPGGKPKITYKDLAAYFDGRQPTLAQTREAVLSIRRSKSIVIDPMDVNSKSAGSFFKNPIISTEIFELLQKAHQNIPSFPAHEGFFKLPAAWLIEQAGIAKGFVHGNAGTSANHSLAIINRGGASASEILALKDLIQQAVKDKFGIMIEPEPIFVGK